LYLYIAVTIIFIAWNTICWSVIWTKRNVNWRKYNFRDTCSPICLGLVDVLNADCKLCSECRPPAEQKISVYCELQVRFRRAATGRSRRSKSHFRRYELAAQGACCPVWYSRTYWNSIEHVVRRITVNFVARARHTRPKRLVWDLMQ